MLMLVLPPLKNVETGNVEALVAFYAATGGVNWIKRDGWRGERPQAGDVKVTNRPDGGP